MLGILGGAADADSDFTTAAGADGLEGPAPGTSSWAFGFALGAAAVSLLTRTEAGT